MLNLERDAKKKTSIKVEPKESTLATLTIICPHTLLTKFSQIKGLEGYI